MEPNTSNINQTLMNAVVALCQRAGEAIMEVYDRDQGFAVDHKADDSPVTEADLAAHRVLVAGLQTLLPAIPILSEEAALPDYQQRRQWQAYWLIDPLDGTKEFVNKNGEFTVNVALVQAGVPVLGVVHVPVKQVTYGGAQGLGAFKWVAGERWAIAVRTLANRGTAGQPVELVASRRHGAEAVEALLERLQTAFGAVTTKDMGSSLKLCLVAEGAADLYPRLAPTAEWDTAAAQAVVEAAGGQVVDDQFALLRYNTKADILNPYFYVYGDKTVDWQTLLQ